MTRGLTVVVFATILAACGGQRAEESSVETFRFETGTEVPLIEARIEDGSIEVIGSDSDAVEVTFRKRARSLDPEIARRLLDRIEVEAIREGDRIRLMARSDRMQRASLGSSLRTELVVQVPRNANLDLRTEDGRLRIEGVRGTIVAETGDGGIAVASTSGSLTLRTEDGSIVGRQIVGAVDAVSEDGRIELDGNFELVRALTSDGSIRIVCQEPSSATGDWTLRTADGSVSVSLPRTISVDIEATTSDGRIENRLSRFDGDQSDGRLRGRLGRGGPLVFISTMDGRIELNEK